MIVIIDGPEKAGKSTFIRSLVDLYQPLIPEIEVRNWGPVSPDDRVYTPFLQKDVDSRFVVWDRSWASEHVYGALLGRNRRLASHPWLGEWYHGRAAQSVGLRIMLLGPSVEWLREHRDSTDLKVDPAMERQMFADYGRRYGWLVVENSPETTGRLLLKITQMLINSRSLGLGAPKPPIYCGPVDAPVVFVGEKRSEKLPPGGWLPFSTDRTTTFGYQLDDLAFKCGWTNAHDCPPQFLRRRKLIVACGKRAESWVHNYVGASSLKVAVAHPSWMYRFNTPSAVAAVRRSGEVLSEVRSILKGDVK